MCKNKRSVVINKALVFLFLLQQLSLFWQDFPVDVGTWLQGFARIQTQTASVRSGIYRVIEPGLQTVFQFTQSYSVEFKLFCIRFSNVYQVHMSFPKVAYLIS